MYYAVVISDKERYDQFLAGKSVEVFDVPAPNNETKLNEGELVEVFLGGTSPENPHCVGVILRNQGVTKSIPPDPPAIRIKVRRAKAEEILRN